MSVRSAPPLGTAPDARAPDTVPSAAAAGMPRVAMQDTAVQDAMAGGVMYFGRHTAMQAEISSNLKHVTDTTLHLGRTMRFFLYSTTYPLSLPFVLWYGGRALAGNLGFLPRREGGVCVVWPFVTELVLVAVVVCLIVIALYELISADVDPNADLNAALGSPHNLVGVLSAWLLLAVRSITVATTWGMLSEQDFRHFCRHEETTEALEQITVRGWSRASAALVRRQLAVASLVAQQSVGAHEFYVSYPPEEEHQYREEILPSGDGPLDKTVRHQMLMVLPPRIEEQLMRGFMPGMVLLTSLVVKRNLKTTLISPNLLRMVPIIQIVMSYGLRMCYAEGPSRLFESSDSATIAYDVAISGSIFALTMSVTRVVGAAIVDYKRKAQLLRDVDQLIEPSWGIEVDEAGGIVVCRCAPFISLARVQNIESYVTLRTLAQAFGRRFANIHQVITGAAAVLLAIVLGVTLLLVYGPQHLNMGIVWVTVFDILCVTAFLASMVWNGGSANASSSRAVRTLEAEQKAIRRRLAELTAPAVARRNDEVRAALRTRTVNKSAEPDAARAGSLQRHLEPHSAGVAMPELAEPSPGRTVSFAEAAVDADDALMSSLNAIPGNPAAERCDAASESARYLRRRLRAGMRGIGLPTDSAGVAGAGGRGGGGSEGGGGRGGERDDAKTPLIDAAGSGAVDGLRRASSGGNGLLERVARGDADDHSEGSGDYARVSTDVEELRACDSMISSAVKLIEVNARRYPVRILGIRASTALLTSGGTLVFSALAAATKVLVGNLVQKLQD